MELTQTLITVVSALGGLELVKWLLPVWVAVGVVIAIGIAKEVYDKVSEKGCCEWKDIMCDLIGIVIGVL